jgi:signal transduction histidine kinase
MTDETWLECETENLAVALAHDLRSPLTAMQVLVERLRSGAFGPVTAHQVAQLAVVQASLLGMTNLTSDVLDLARDGRNLIGPSPIPFSLHAVWEQVRGVVLPIAVERRLTLRFAAAVPDVCLGHPAALQRLWLNLVSNALRYTAAGAVTVSVEHATDESLRFVVDDTGRGLPPEVVELLSSTENALGVARPITQTTGLGLRLCQRLLAHFGSSLHAEPREAGGTRMSFTVPWTVLAELPSAVSR